MEFVASLVSGFIQVVLALGTMLLIALASLIILRALPATLRAGAAFGLAVGCALGDVLAAALRCLTRIAGLLVRVAIVAGVFMAGVRSGPLVWVAYGADVPALIPACMVVTLPLGAAFEFNPPLGRTWGAVAAWGAVVLVIGAIVDVADSITRSLLLVGVLTTITAYAQIQERSDEHSEARQE
jgi:hypothetical protein